MFYHYRPFLPGEGENDYMRIFEGDRPMWDQGRWWYRLAHVCQRWRNLILGSASYLGLSLVCTNGTPVESMLAHSPPLPLTVDYSGCYVTAKDLQGILLALEKRDRVLHLCLSYRPSDLLKLGMAIDGEFPILECLSLDARVVSTILMLPRTFKAPNLRHLKLRCPQHPIPILSQLHPASVGLVTLFLVESGYEHPNILLRWISFMPQLESLMIHFELPNFSTHAPITTRITLPNLRLFRFRGDSPYLEAIVHQMKTPLLKILEIHLRCQSTFFVPHLVWFINRTVSPRFDNAKLVFKDNEIDVVMSSREAHTYIFSVTCHWEYPAVYIVAQICNALRQVLSAVEHFTFRRNHFRQYYLLAVARAPHGHS